jgi:hypothetical protein
MPRPIPDDVERVRTSRGAPRSWFVPGWAARGRRSGGWACSRTRESARLQIQSGSREWQVVAASASRRFAPVVSCADGVVGWGCGRVERRERPRPRDRPTPQTSRQRRSDRLASRASPLRAAAGKTWPNHNSCTRLHRGDSHRSLVPQARARGGWCRPGMHTAGPRRACAPTPHTLSSSWPSACYVSNRRRPDAPQGVACA